MIVENCKKLLNDLGVSVNLIIPEGGSVTELHRLPEAWFNIVPYREVGLMTANYLSKEFDMPFVSTTPMGVVDTALFIRQIEDICNKMTSTNQLCSQDIGTTKQSSIQESLTDKKDQIPSSFDFEEYIDQQTRFCFSSRVVLSIY